LSKVASPWCLLDASTDVVLRVLESSLGEPPVTEEEVRF
jgi:hypothetical protein